nr:hypothetical protein [Tanacetum cinerariifolium]
MPHPSRYFEFAETSTEEMMREWMASQTKANELQQKEFLTLEESSSTTLPTKLFKSSRTKSFSSEFQISTKTVVFADGSNIDSYPTMLMEKFKDLVTKINYGFLIKRNELKEMQDDHRDNYASQIYMKDDTPMFRQIQNIVMDVAFDSVVGIKDSDSLGYGFDRNMNSWNFGHDILGRNWLHEVHTSTCHPSCRFVKRSCLYDRLASL